MLVHEVLALKHTSFIFQLKQKTTELTWACQKQYELEQELAFHKIDAKFDPLPFYPNHVSFIKTYFIVIIDFKYACACARWLSPFIQQPFGNICACSEMSTTLLYPQYAIRLLSRDITSFQ